MINSNPYSGSSFPSMLVIFDLIGDPCAGSGSTLITARKHNRNSLGFELDSKAVQNFNQYLSENKTLFEVGI